MTLALAISLQYSDILPLNPIHISEVSPHFFYSSPSAVCVESLVETPSAVLEKSPV